MKANKKQKRIMSLGITNLVNFSGNKLFLPIVSLFLLFFYILFFGLSGTYDLTIRLDGQNPGWVQWFVLAIGSLVFALLWLFCNGWCNKWFLYASVLIFVSSFFWCQVFIYPETLRYSKSLPFLFLFLSVVVVWLGGIFDRLWSFNSCWQALLLLLQQCIFYIAENIVYGLSFSVILLLILSIVNVSITERYYKSLIVLCIVAFYVCVIYLYLPINPKFYYENFKIKAISLLGGKPSFVLEDENNEFIIVNRSGKKNCDFSFDYYDYSSAGYPVVGFKNVDLKKNVNFDLQPNNHHHISITDSCVCFSTMNLMYESLKDFQMKDTLDVVKTITSCIYFDYINLFDKKDSISADNLFCHYKSLQEELIRRTIDSTEIKSYDIVRGSAILRDYSYNVSLALLNALALDLIENEDYKTAFKVFSWQFYFVFYETIIYDNINLNFNVNVNYVDYVDKKSKMFSFSSENLRNELAFEYWLLAKDLSIAYVADYLSIKQNEKVSEITSLLLKNLKSGSLLDQFALSLRRENMMSLKSSLEEYDYVPNLCDYLANLQLFLYDCVKRDYMSNYNSFFFNLYTDISFLIPFNPLSISAYEDFKLLYNNRFDLRMNHVKDVINGIEESISNIDENLLLQQTVLNMIDSIGTQIGINADLLKKVFDKPISELTTK